MKKSLVSSVAHGKHVRAVAAADLAAVRGGSPDEAIAPQDASTGTSTGKRQYNPVVITTGL